MPAIRTEVTEIVTGLAMLGYDDLDRALATRPGTIQNVTGAHFDRLVDAKDQGELATEFATAWETGQAFARAADGLRGRPPWLIEWKGRHRPPGYEQLPADLRVDHVYLISCKYGSNILLNASPVHLFDHRLGDKPPGRSSDWFETVAGKELQDLYAACRPAVAELEGDDGLDRPGGALPDTVTELLAAHRNRLKAALKGTWPDTVLDDYLWFAAVVSHQTAERWRRGMRTDSVREEMLWRLLRLQAAPYFVLGAAVDGSPLAFRVGTPWDFRAAYTLKSFDVWPESLGQPMVRWRAEVWVKPGRTPKVVEGHVEIRWSHGRFAGAPEAKVYLDTAHHDVPGYFPLT